MAGPSKASQTSLINREVHEELAKKICNIKLSTTDTLFQTEFRAHRYRFEPTTWHTQAGIHRYTFCNPLIVNEAFESSAKQLCEAFLNGVSSILSHVLLQSHKSVRVDEEVVRRARQILLKTLPGDIKYTPFVQPWSWDVTNLLMSRLDVMFTEDFKELQVIELNCGPVGGKDLSQAYASAYNQHVNFQQCKAKPLDNNNYQLAHDIKVLYTNWAQSKGLGTQQPYALFMETPTSHFMLDLEVELQAVRETCQYVFWFTHKYSTASSHEESISYKDGKLLIEGKHVTLLWQTEQMVKEPISAVYLLIQEAVSDGALLWLPHPACCLAHNKALFHILSDPYFEKLLPPSDSKFIHKSIPLSRLLHRSAWNNADEFDNFVYLILQHKDNYVMKPVFLYGGQGVIVGKSVSHKKWTSHLSSCLEAPIERAYIVQELVSQPLVSMVHYDCEAKVVVSQSNLGIGVFASGNHYTGAFVRAGPKDVVNTTQGARVSFASKQNLLYRNVVENE